MTSDVPGSARLVLAANVVPLDEPATVFRAMLEGWARQQRSRFFSEKGTIAPRIRLVKRFATFTGFYPWQWTAAEAEAWIGDLRSGSEKVSISTLAITRPKFDCFASISSTAATVGGKCVSNVSGNSPKLFSTNTTPLPTSLSTRVIQGAVL